MVLQGSTETHLRRATHERKRKETVAFKNILVADIPDTAIAGLLSGGWGGQLPIPLDLSQHTYFLHGTISTAFFHPAHHQELPQIWPWLQDKVE